MPTVAVFGAGIAAMSAAHELARLGYRVSVHEATGEAGGFFRSARLPRDEGMPSEYSWHGFGPWYHNTFGIMQQIPFDDRGSVYDSLSAGHRTAMAETRKVHPGRTGPETAGSCCEGRAASTGSIPGFGTWKGME